MRIILSGLCTFALITSSVIIKNECGKDIINYNIKDIEIRQINTSLIGLSDKCIEKDPKIESFRIFFKRIRFKTDYYQRTILSYKSS